MNDDFASLQAQANAIQVANRIAKDVQKQMADLMAKMVTSLVCGLCNAENANTWLATTCINEHVMTTRVCRNCMYRYGIEITQKCVKCAERTLDWAVKEDDSSMWAKSWADQ